MKELAKIQGLLNCPKGQKNTFGNYMYRSCEDILEALKPLLAETETYLTLADDMVAVGNRIYVKATATLHNSHGESVTTTAYAREEETKKGMDGSQITGAASSYARKYALNGLFAIDDTKDADATNRHGNDRPSTTRRTAPAPMPATDLSAVTNEALNRIAAARTADECRAIFGEYKQSQPAICNAGTAFFIATKEKVESLSAAG